MLVRCDKVRQVRKGVVSEPFGQLSILGCSVSGSRCFTEPPPLAVMESLRLPPGPDVFARTNSHPGGTRQLLAGVFPKRDRNC